MNNLVKTTLVSLLFPLLIFTALAPQGASGALSDSAWDITIAPAATNAAFGTVSSLIATITIGEGSKLVSSGTGVTLSVAVSPAVAGVTASLASNGPFTANGATTTLTISSTATADGTASPPRIMAPMISAWERLMRWSIKCLSAAALRPPTATARMWPEMARSYLAPGRLT